MPIQLVNRPDADFRGYSGLIARGDVHPGMPVKLLPSGRVTKIVRIVTYDGDLDHASTGRSVTLTFADQIDASRGDIVVGIDKAPALTDRIGARLFWMNSEALTPGRNYLFKLATTTVTAKIEPQISIFDLDTQRAVTAESVAQNEIASGTLKLDRPIAVDRYAACKDTGSFILIDPETYDTVGMGCVEEVLPPADAKGRFVRWTETHSRSLAKAVSWRATGSLDTFVVALVITGSGKIAGSVALTEILTKIVIYYFHERIWAWIPWGKGGVTNAGTPK